MNVHGPAVARARTASISRGVAAVRCATTSTRAATLSSAAAMGEILRFGWAADEEFRTAQSARDAHEVRDHTCRERQAIAVPRWCSAWQARARAAILERCPSSSGAQPRPTHAPPPTTITATLDDGLCGAHTSRFRLFRAGRRARSMRLPTTAAPSATASRNGFRAVHPRCTRSSTAYRRNSMAPRWARRANTSEQGRGAGPERDTISRQGHFTAPAKQLRAGHRPARRRAVT